MRTIEKTTIKMDRQKLLEKLRENLAAATEYDKDIAKQNEADKKQVMAAFRQSLKDAMKWDFGKAYNENFRPSGNFRVQTRYRQAPLIASIIKYVEADARKTIGFNTQSSTAMAVFWKPPVEQS